MSYVYEVGAINFFNLSEAERNSVLAAFAAALQQLSSAVFFHVKLDKMTVIEGNGERIPFSSRGVIATIYPNAGEIVLTNGPTLAFPQCTIEIPIPDYGFILSGDGLFAYGTVMLYPNGICSE